jgi:putrescine transport system substrate-binding protein
MVASVLAAVLLAGCGQKEPRAGAPASQAHSADSSLNVGAQSGTLAPQTLEQVRAKTGLQLRQPPIASPGELESRLLAGRSGFDVVVVPWQFVSRQVRAGLFHKLDKRELPNLEHADAEVMQQLSAGDPGNELAVPYRRQTTGIAVDRQRLAAVIQDANPHDWNLLFDARHAQKLAGCGVYVPDAPQEMMSLALLWLGRDPNSDRPEDLQAAAGALRAIKPYVQRFDPSRMAQELSAGKPCLAVVDDTAALPGGQLDYGVPPQGTIAWVDVLAIPADARQLRQAHAFINALIDAQRGPQAAATAKAFVLAPHGEAYAAEVARLWAEFSAH